MVHAVCLNTYVDQFLCVFLNQLLIYFVNLIVGEEESN